jgi:uncharacterized protein (TIGR02300 family)
MKKSTAKNEGPVALGTKRTCPKCAAKFYDFNKKELTCPKCNAEFDASAIVPPHKYPIKAEKKERPEPTPVPGDEAPEAAAEFESVDDLGDDDAAEEIEVVEEKTDEEY